MLAARGKGTFAAGPSDGSANGRLMRNLLNVTPAFPRSVSIILALRKNWRFGVGRRFTVAPSGLGLGRCRRQHLCLGLRPRRHLIGRFYNQLPPRIPPHLELKLPFPKAKSPGIRRLAFRTTGYASL